MINTLLFIHVIIAILLIVVILLQKTSTDGIGGGGGGNNMGLVSGRTAANFLTKTTMILAAIFFCNAIILANLSSPSRSTSIIEMENTKEQKNTDPVTESLPIAK